MQTKNFMGLLSIGNNLVLKITQLTVNIQANDCNLNKNEFWLRMKTARTEAKYEFEFWKDLLFGFSADPSLRFAPFRMTVYSGQPHKRDCHPEEARLVYASE